MKSRDVQTIILNYLSPNTYIVIIIYVIYTCLFILPQNYNAKISIGLAKLEPSSSDRPVILKGTYGYAAPECVETGN